ncbi:MAG: hypothetical protein AB7O24_04695 [Kofleriaceae bacterium]
MGELRAMFGAGTKELIELIPVIGTVAKVMTEAEKRARVQRIEDLITWMQGTDEEADAFAEEMSTGVNGPEGDLYRAAFRASVQATLDAVADVAVPSIALLARHRLQKQSPDLRSYRAVLGMLESLDREEFEALRAAVHSLLAIDADPHFTFLSQDPTVADIVMGTQSDTARSWVWHSTDPDRTLLARGDVARRLVAALEPLTDVYNIIGPVRGRNEPRLAHSLVQLLVLIMPSPIPTAA